VNDNDCDVIKDLYDESTNYIKTICFIPLKRTFDAADEKCQSYGMFLYNADDPEAEKAMLDFSNTRFSPSLGYALYLEGKTSEGCVVVANEEGLFRVAFANCTEKFSFYCQFTREPKATEPGKIAKRQT
jgi:hypothetical protein